MPSQDTALTGPQQKKAEILFTAIPATHLTKYHITTVPTTVGALYALAEVSHCYLHDIDPAQMSALISYLYEQDSE